MMLPKVGDKVYVKPLKDIDVDHVQFGFVKEMHQYCRCVVTIADITKTADHGKPRFTIEEDDGEWDWSIDMFDRFAKIPQWDPVGPVGPRGPHGRDLVVGDMVKLHDNLKQGGRYRVYCAPQMEELAGMEAKIIKVVEIDGVGVAYKLDIGHDYHYTEDMFTLLDIPPKKPAKAKKNHQAITTLNKLDNRSLFRVGGLFEGKARVCKMHFFDWHGPGDRAPAIILVPMVGDLQTQTIREADLIKKLASGEITIMCIERG